MGVWGRGGSGPSGYDYVQTAQPVDAKEGETWYDVDGDAAFVFDGAAWIEMTVTDHAQLSGVNPGAHRSDSNIVSTADGKVNAKTLGGHSPSRWDSLPYFTNVSDVELGTEYQVASSGGNYTVNIANDNKRVSDTITVDTTNLYRVKIHWSGYMENSDYGATLHLAGNYSANSGGGSQQVGNTFNGTRGWNLDVRGVSGSQSFYVTASGGTAADTLHGRWIRGYRNTTWGDVEGSV